MKTTDASLKATVTDVDNRFLDFMMDIFLAIRVRSDQHPYFFTSANGGLLLNLSLRWPCH